MTIFVLVTITFFLLALAAYMLLIKEQEELRKRVDERFERLLRSKAHKNTEEVSILRKELMGELSWFNRWLLTYRFTNNLYLLVEQSGVRIQVHQLVLLCLGLACFSGALVWIIRESVPVAVLVGVMIGYLPVMVVSYKRKRRLEAFLEQLPDTLDLITRALRAGHALTSSLQTVAEEMPDPIATEFRKTFEEQNLGIDIKSAFANLLRRVPVLDLQLCVTAILIQRETGGNLAEILENIANVIRERFKILGQVK
ncbi:MAG: type II secretion system F family protein, partial [Acidobacteria bacterium]|nr:type II secretion system F family protein [Acidobacteriota bacterium]